MSDEPATLGIAIRDISVPSILRDFEWTCAAEILDGVAPPNYSRTVGSLPPEMSRAAPKRIAEFLAGRHCASLALRAAGCSEQLEIGIGHSGSPVWPAGLIGSITHTSRVAVAVVVRDDEFRGIGIDCEHIMSARTTSEVAHMVLPEAADVELVGDASTRLDWNTFVTAVFSAKESIYKCVRPLVDDFFDFGDVHLVSVDPDKGVLRMRVARSLGRGFTKGTELESRFLISGAFVHTLTLLERTPAWSVAPCK